MIRRADRVGERSFEDAVVAGLRHCDAEGRERWYHYVPPVAEEASDTLRFNRDTALDEQTLFEFLETTQPKEVAKVRLQYGDTWSSQVLKRLTKVIEDQGLLKTLRNGFSMVPNAHFRLIWFKPANNLNREAMLDYRSNRFVVTRQLRYGTRATDRNNSLDVVLMVNGFPLVTMELKNRQTGQSVFDAITQYKRDRDSRELIFKPDMRSLVHFAVDGDLVYMTTKLDGDRTVFLPFNKGNGKNGAGNPPNPEGFRTEYLWNETLAPDSLLDIIERFIQIEYKGQDRSPRLRRCPANIAKVIFPRYHQLNAVRRLVAATRDEGPGHNYLIQHSTGSGKSNTIAWLAYELPELTTPDGGMMFDSVIVLTDRVILDRQLQDNITGMAHKVGMVRKVESHSRELLDAINAGVRIIISTIQKFPYIYEDTHVEGRSFAIIIDEAHSSQSGETHRKTKEALGEHGSLNADWEEDADSEAEDDAAVRIKRELEAQGTQSNLSFYAFTATPKAVTLETFGRKGEDGHYQAFDLYSMKQAIEEGFILDPLKNYTTFRTYFELIKATAEDPDKSSAKATRDLMNFVKLHETNIRKKSEIILDHFCSRVARLLRGHAKAMIVTDSRAAAIKYYRCITRLAKRAEYRSVRPIVAFSGSKEVGGVEETEQGLNGFESSQIAKRFDTDEFNLMIVANKFQTGFDQPKLCAMYVDKKLSGVAAVQTISRINRPYPGKRDPFVLDFVNDTDTIRKSFEPYYTESELDRATDPNAIYDMKTSLDDFGIIDEADVEKIARIWYGNPGTDVLLQVQQLLQPAIDRFLELSEERQDEFRKRVSKFVRSYLYITQMVRLDDEGLLKYNTYLQLLDRELRRLGTGDDGVGVLDGEVALAHLSIDRIGTSTIELKGGEQVKNAGGSVGVRKPDPKKPLSELIARINDIFGGDFGDASEKFLESVSSELERNQLLWLQAQSNSRSDFAKQFKEPFIDALINAKNENGDFVSLLTSTPDAMNLVRETLLDLFFAKANEDRTAEGTNQ